MNLADRLTARLQARSLDRALAAGASPENSVPMSVRARALVRADSRRELAGALRRITRNGVSPATLGSRVTASGVRVSEMRADLERLAARLLEPGPVAARGVALTQDLLSDGTGPLFWTGSHDDLSDRLRQALEALEPRAQEEPQRVETK